MNSMIYEIIKSNFIDLSTLNGLELIDRADNQQVILGARYIIKCRPYIGQTIDINIYDKDSFNKLLRKWKSFKEKSLGI